ncbi:MAG: 1-(5-phosphoribosyl)-5-((5-phosphoribosylamino)methylideneamino)imidazole-4-carboxamide isomerase, partial [Nitrospiraceae bacterium]
MLQIEAILKTVSIPVQIGGGIRTLEAIRLYLSRGAARVVLGTTALESWTLLEQACAEFPNRILIGIDARDGKVAVRGWTSLSRSSAFELARRLEGYPLAG